MFSGPWAARRGQLCPFPPERRWGKCRCCVCVETRSCRGRDPLLSGRCPLYNPGSPSRCGYVWMRANRSGESYWWCTIWVCNIVKQVIKFKANFIKLRKFTQHKEKQDLWGLNIKLVGTQAEITFCIKGPLPLTLVSPQPPACWRCQHPRTRHQTAISAGQARHTGQNPSGSRSSCPCRSSAASARTWC